MLKHYDRLFAEKCTKNSTHLAGGINNRKYSRTLLFTRLFRNRRRLLFFALFLFVIFSFFATFGLICTYPFCTTNNRLFNSNFDQFTDSLKTETDLNYLASTKLAIDSILSSKLAHSFNTVSFTQIHDSINKIEPFNLNSNDVLVFLHMQKTGGSSFDRHLTKDLFLDHPCLCETRKKKKCRCLRPNKKNQYWLFSRYSIGWKCGLHADYTELVNCVDRVLRHVESNTTSINSQAFSSSEDELLTSNKVLSAESKPHQPKRYFYLTLLRDPISRFISEFKHVQRGATWKTSRHWCGGRLPTIRELPSCFNGQNWKNVQINEFLSCKDNLAFNRQTRMLADLNLVGCYNRSILSQTEREEILFQSAKRNLEKMAFFGLCEEQLTSQYMFEKTFNLKFRRPFVQFNLTRSLTEQKLLLPQVIDNIRRLNHLDVKLYSWARKLFRERFNRLRNQDENFEKVYFDMLQKSTNQSQKAPIRIRTAGENFELEDKEKDIDHEDDKYIDDSAGGYDDKINNSLEDYYSL